MPVVMHKLQHVDSDRAELQRQLDRERAVRRRQRERATRKKRREAAHRAHERRLRGENSDESEGALRARSAARARDAKIVASAAMEASENVEGDIVGDADAGTAGMGAAGLLSVAGDAPPSPGPRALDFSGVGDSAPEAPAGAVGAVVGAGADGVVASALTVAAVSYVPAATVTAARRSGGVSAASGSRPAAAVGGEGGVEFSADAAAAEQQEASGGGEPVSPGAGDDIDGDANGGVPADLGGELPVSPKSGGDEERDGAAAVDALVEHGGGSAADQKTTFVVKRVTKPKRDLPKLTRGITARLNLDPVAQDYDIVDLANGDLMRGIAKLEGEWHDLSLLKYRLLQAGTKDVEAYKLRLLAEEEARQVALKVPPSLCASCWCVCVKYRWCTRR